MTAYYDSRYPNYEWSHNPGYERYGIEYPGYDPTWNLGRPSYPPSYRNYFRSRAVDYLDAPYNHSAWLAEAPTRLRVNFCCDRCKMKMENALSDIRGVYDVDIEGWDNAMVTVRGTASPRKILKEARKILNNSEFWSDSHYADQYQGYSPYNRRH